MKKLLIIKISTKVSHIVSELKAIGADETGAAIMLPKFNHLVIKICDIKTTPALIIKQEMLAKGGEVATPKNMITHQIEQGDILISGTISQYNSLITKLKMQQFGLKELADDLAGMINQKTLPVIKIRNTIMDFNQHAYLMGVLNITPDSFSDGGQFLNIDTALKHAEKMIAEGADIIDIGGQSTRPGAKAISAEEEIKRILPIIKEIRARYNIPLSIDTFQSVVAKAALDEGADMINDISGLHFDPEMASIAAAAGCPVILMHIQGTPQNMQQNPIYTDLMREIIDYLNNSITIAKDNGIKKENLIIDPGIGFGKTLKHNMIILNRLRELTSLNCPILIGTSNKSFIGKLLSEEVNERLIGTAITNTIGLMNGANIIRVHEIKELKKAIIIADAIKNSEGGA